MKKKNGPGCCGCGAAPHLCVRASTCGIGAAPGSVAVTNAVITIKDGSGATIATGTGEACFTPISGTTYTATAAASGYTTGTLTSTYTGARWSVDFTTVGMAQIQFGCCFCVPAPGTLTMNSADESCNYGMFRTGTILYGMTPAGYASLALGANIFLGATDFPDPVTINNGPGGWTDSHGTFHTDPATFRYYLTCQYNQWILSRLYLESPYGSPYRDSPLYTWFIGGYGNTCTPFALNNGVAFPGSDVSCSVTISG